jgi:hypothetical protein
MQNSRTLLMTSSFSFLFFLLYEVFKAVLSCALLIWIVVLMAGSIPAAFVGEKGRLVCKTKILIK